MHIRCPQCSQRLQLPQSKVGVPIHCPSCGGLLSADALGHVSSVTVLDHHGAQPVAAPEPQLVAIPVETTEPHRGTASALKKTNALLLILIVLIALPLLVCGGVVAMAVVPWQRILANSRCPVCKHRFWIDESYRGNLLHDVRCPGCGNELPAPWFFIDNQEPEKGKKK